MPAPAGRRSRGPLPNRSDRLIDSLLRRPAIGAGPARLLIVAMIVLVAFVDYASGIRISLAVFYLIPIALTVSWFDWKEATAATFFSVALRILGDWSSIDEESLPLWSWWNSLASLTILLIVVWILDALLSLRRQLELRIDERTARLVEAAAVQRHLEQELVLVGARERNAFGQELHDDICQHLVGTAFAAKVHMSNLQTQGSPHVDEAQALVGWLEESAQKTRRLARGLLLAEIAPDRLGEQIQQLIDDGRPSGVFCRFHQVGDVVLPDAAVAGQVFRIAQEALRNALRHAAPTEVEISLVGDSDAICLVVEDDGREPFDAGRSTDGMGLRIMAHRASFIGGRLSVVPSSGRGTRVILHLPRVANDAR